MAEVGLERHKIVTSVMMNTTSRLEGLAKELDLEIVISTDLLELLRPLPSTVSTIDLSLRDLRGHDQPLAMSAICRRQTDKGPHRIHQRCIAVDRHILVADSLTESAVKGTLEHAS